MEMRNLPLSKLEDDRCKWQREINTVLEDYKNAKEISTQIRKEESLKEVHINPNNFVNNFECKLN